MAGSLPNTAPLYTKDILNWDARLTNQVAGRKLTVESPVKLGQFGLFGGVVWSIRAVPLGANVATNLRIYGYASTGVTPADFRMLFEVALPAIDDVTAEHNSVIAVGNNSTLSAPTPIEVPLPRIYTRNTEESRGLVRTSNYSLYCALSREVVSGWDVFVEGGDY